MVDIEAGLARLRQSRDRHEFELRQRLDESYDKQRSLGLLVGRRWALEAATYTDLALLAEAREADLEAAQECVAEALGGRAATAVFGDVADAIDAPAWSGFLAGAVEVFDQV